MRIDANNKLKEIGEASEQPGSRTAAAKPVRTGPGEDTAELSVDKARVQSLVQEVIRLPEVRQEKVAEFSLAIKQGGYEVSPERTAEAILTEFKIRTAA